MADTVRVVDYYHVNVPQRAGQGAELLSVFERARVNLLAVHAFPSGRGAQVDLVPADARSFARVARAAGLRPSRAKRAFLIEGDDRVGALQRVMAHLGEAGINVTATTAVRAGKGRYGAILWVRPAQFRKAAQALRARGR